MDVKIPPTKWYPSTTPSSARAWPGLAGEDVPAHMDRKQWPVLKAPFAEVIAGRTRDARMAVFDGSDACVTPVLEPDEVQENRT